MITSGPEFDKFVVEPWMDLEPWIDIEPMFNLLPIPPFYKEKLFLNHPYKILVKFIYKFYPNYKSDEEDKYHKDHTDFYFRILDDYNRYGIAFNSYPKLFPDNKLCVFEDKKYGKPIYKLVNNWHDKKTLLFNNVKTIDLNKHDMGKKPLSITEKLKRNFIKKQTNKKLQVALMDPDVYNNDELFKDVIEKTDKQETLIEKLNHRLSHHGFDDFLRINFD